MLCIKINKHFFLKLVQKINEQTQSEYSWTKKLYNVLIFKKWQVLFLESYHMIRPSTLYAFFINLHVICFYYQRLSLVSQSLYGIWTNHHQAREITMLWPALGVFTLIIKVTVENFYLLKVIQILNVPFSYFCLLWFWKQNMLKDSYKISKLKLIHNDFSLSS